MKLFVDLTDRTFLDDLPANGGMLIESLDLNRRAAEMDARGVEWCEQNIEVIVGWLREEAGKRGLPFVDMAGTALVKLAIRKAKKINGDFQNGAD